MIYICNLYTDAYPVPQYPQQPYPVQDPNAGLQYYPPQVAATNQMPYPTQPPPPYDIEKEKGVHPLPQQQAVHVRK